MRISVGLVDWLVSTQVVNETHITKPQKSSDTFALKTEAARAADSGHLAYYIVYNLAQQLGVQLPSKTLKGSPGEVCNAAQKRHNWNTVVQLLNAVGMAYAPNMDALVAGTATIQAMEDIRLFWQMALAPPPPPEPEPEHRKRTVEDDIQRAQEKHARRLAEEARAAAQEARRQANAALLKEAVIMSLDVERYRLDLNTFGAAPLPVYTEFKNRAAVQFCHSIVENIIADVTSGAAVVRFDAEWTRQQQVRRHALERKQAGSRLADHHSALHLDRHVDHRLALFMKNIVVEMVNRCSDPDILDVLARRDIERTRDRIIVNRIHARVSLEIEEKLAAPPPPLKVRLEQAKQAAEEQEEEERRRREEVIERFREDNKAFALEQQAKRQKKEQEEWEAAAEAREKARKKQQELEEHKARSKMITLHNKMQRLLFDMETSERQDAEKEEATLRKKIMGIATRERRELREAAEAQQEPTVPLSSVSIGTGLGAGYQGTTYGGQFMTALEAQLFDAVNAVRTEPSAHAKRIMGMKSQFKNQKMLIPCRNGQIEPLLTVEGSEVIDNAAAALSRARPCRPAAGEPCIGLTLAAREHACDLAYHGIANTTQHIGSNRSSTSTRASRYGNALSLSGATITELVTGFVRPSLSTMSAEDFVNTWLLCDGDETRADRKSLLGSGPGYQSIGVGHAVALFEDRTVEVFVVLYCSEYAEKSVSQMAAAHRAAISEVASPYLKGTRACHPDVTLRTLLATTNCVIGRTAAMPNMKLLTKALRSPRSAAHKMPVNQDDAPQEREPKTVTTQREVTQAPQRKSVVETRRASHGDEFRAQQHNPRHPSGAQPKTLPPQRLETMENRPPPPQPAMARDSPPPQPAPPMRKERFVATPPLPPVSQPKPQPAAAAQLPSCAQMAALRWLLRWKLARRRRALTSLSAFEKRQMATYAAVLIQRIYRGHRGRSTARLVRANADADRMDRLRESEEQEKYYGATMAQMAGRRLVVANEIKFKEAFNAARTVVDVIVDVAGDTWLRQRQQLEWVSRCRKLLTGVGAAEPHAAEAQLQKYHGRELVLLTALVKQFGTEPDLVQDCTTLCTALSSSQDVKSLLLDNVGYEADVICKLDRKRACCIRCCRKWKRFVAKRKNRPEYLAAQTLQRFYHQQYNDDRIDYVVNHRPRILLKLRLAKFYQRYNPDKINEVGSLAAKYVGAEDRLFEALTAKYGPE